MKNSLFNNLLMTAVIITVATVGMKCYANKPVIQTKYTADPAVNHVGDAGDKDDTDRPLTFCNPLDLPYRFTTKDSHYSKGVSCRESADATMVAYKGEYWLFASKVGGYWHSKDMLNWDLIEPTGFPIEDYAPTVLVVGGKWILAISAGSALYMSENPATGKWIKLRDFARYSDPALFLDDDGRVYLYWGSSSDQWMQGCELDPGNNFEPIGTAQSLIPGANPFLHGWEAMDPTMTDDELKNSQAWTEGVWMNKHNGNYYLQYAVPASEVRGYADGVYVSENPLGPFRYVPYNPVSYKPTGFIGAAGHGSTYQDNGGRYWHIATMVVGVGYMWDRRLGLFPSGYLPNGSDPDQLVCNTYLGDYPQLAPGLAKDPLTDNTVGWMLVSLKKKATASSNLDDQHTPNRAFDEDVSTSWAAATANSGEWLQVDLGKLCRIDAIQFNFADIKSTAYGRLNNDTYQYMLDISDDGKTWQPCVDRRSNERDAPHEYIQLDKPVTARYARLTNYHTPAGAVFSVSGLRIFGSGMGKAPEKVTGITAARQKNRRFMDVSWQASPSADFYIVRYGIKPDRLTLNYQVYSSNSVTIPGLNTDVEYFVTVDAVNDSGVTKGTRIQPVIQSGAPSDKDMAAYLMVYHKDEDHSLHFALSSDGYSFTDVNGGKPVIQGRDIAEQKGIRDPYIMRGPDNLFYMAMTDLHIYAKNEGLRATEWQRDGEKYGWGNNSSLVLMKSSDLVNWSSTDLHVDQAFPGFEEIGCAWAPEMIYDAQKKKLMVYFTMRFLNGNHCLYYSYVDDAFTKLETKPEPLFEYPKNISCIDGDIIQVGDKFHLFYVAHDGTPGIKQAVSDSLTSGYVYDPAWCDLEPKACEAPNVWKRNGEDKWVLMYDSYGTEPHNFGFRETTDFKTFTDLGRFNEGVMKATNFFIPKHGAVMSLTAEEARQLADHWGLKKY